MTGSALVRRDGSRRVLWVTKGLGPGGAERLLVSLAGALGSLEGLQVAAVRLLPNKDHLVDDLRSRGVRSDCLSRATWDLRWLPRLRTRMRGVDVVHVHSPVPAVAARVLARTMRQGPRLIVTEHNSWRSHHWLTRVANWLTVGLEDDLLAVSDEVRSSMPPRARRRCRVVRHGIDVAATRAARVHRPDVRAELGIEPGETLVVSVANLRATKDHPGLQDAAALVLEERQDVTFVVAGQGPLAGELEQRRQALGLGRRFRYLGYVRDVPRLLSGGDVFVLGSRHEGLPIALMEALALGLPVVATDVGGISAVVDDGLDGLLVEAGRPAALSDAILALVADRARRARMRARQDARDDLGIDAAARIHEELYRAGRTDRGCRGPDP